MFSQKEHSSVFASGLVRHWARTDGLSASIILRSCLTIGVCVRVQGVYVCVRLHLSMCFRSL